MQFDNASFNTGVAETMSLLDRFKKALRFDGAQKGLQELQKAANTLDLSGMEKSASAVEVKFNAMSMVAVSAIDRIVNSAMNAGTSILKSLTIDPPTTGFSKYEEKTKAVVTIMNATGKSIDEVNEQLDRLNLFTDETSYNFTDMVANIGKFTANNIPLEQAVAAMEGIANLAAVSGQGINEASRAMYNFSQAIGAGFVKKIDWNSIVNANMATAEFKETIIDTAIELGVLKKSEDGFGRTLKGTTVNVQTFDNTLSESWFTSEVLIKSLNKYGNYADEVLSLMQKEGVSCAEAMEILGGNLEDVGVKGFKAAQEAKTFTDAIEATKDAVSTGWSKSFELIFGNYEEAKEMWTDLTSVLYDIFASSAERRNEILKEWKDLGGRDDLLAGLSKAWENITNILRQVRKAAEEVFPPMTGEKLKAITDKFGELAERLTLSEEACYTLKVAAKVVLVPLKLLADTFVILAKFAFITTTILFKMGNAFLSLFAKAQPLDGILRKTLGDERAVKVMEIGNRVVNRLASAFYKVTAKIKSFLGKFVGVNEEMTTFTDFLKPLQKIGDVLLDAVIDGFDRLSKINLTPIRKFGNTTLKLLVSGFSQLADLLSPLTNGIKNFFAQFKDAEPAQYLDIIGNSIKNLYTTVRDFLSQGFNFGSLFAGLEEKFPNLVKGFRDLGSAMINFVKNLSPSKILIFSFGTAIVGVMFSMINVMDKAKNAIGGLSSIFTTVNIMLKGFAKTYPVITQISKAIVILTAALVILSRIDRDKLINAVASISAVMGLFGILTGGMALLDKYIIKNSKSFWNVAVAMTALSGGVVALSLALKILSDIKLDGPGILKSLGVLTVIMAEFYAVTALMGKKKIGFDKNVIFMIGFVSAVNILINGLQKLEDAKLENIPAVLSSLGITLAALSLLAKTISKVKFSSSAGITLLIADLLFMSKALAALSHQNGGQILKGVIAFIPIVAAIDLLAITSKAAGKHAAGAGKYILAISAGILILVQTIKNVSKLNRNEIIQGTAAISALLVMFGVITGISHFAGETKGLGKTILAMSAAILLLGVSIDYIGSLSQEEVIRGIAVVSGLLGIFTIMMAVGKAAKKATAPIAAVTVAVGLITSSLMLLTLIPFKEVMGASAALSMALVAFGVAMNLVSKVVAFSSGKSSIISQLKNIGVLIGLLGGVLFVLVKTFETLQGINTNSMVTSANSLSLVMLALAAATRVMKTLNVSLDTLKMVGILGLVLGEAVLVLGLLDGFTNAEGLVTKAGALSIVMLSISASTRIMKSMDVSMDTLKTVGILGLVLAEAIAALWALNKLTDPDGLSQKVSAMTSLLFKITGLTAVLSLLGKIPGLIGAAASGAAALASVLGILELTLTAIGGVMSIPHVGDWIKKAPEFFETLGDCVGRVIGGIVGGFNKAVSDTMPNVAYNMSAFITNLQPFFDGLDTVTEDKVAAIERLANAFDIISDLNVQNLEGKLSFLGTEMANFGPNFAAFGDSIANVNPEIVVSATAAAESFAAIAEKVAGLGDINNLKFASFGEELRTFGQYFKGYYNWVSGITDMNVVDASVAAADSLAAFANKIPGKEGVLQAFAGEKSLSNFGVELSIFGRYFHGYYNNIQGVDLKVVDQTTAIIDSVIAYANRIPSQGGLLQKLFGEQSLSNFGLELSRFGFYFNGYYINVRNIGDDVYDKSQKIADSVKILVESIPESEGIWQNIFGGGKDYSEFSEGLKTISDALQELVNSVDLEQFRDLGKSIIAAIGTGATDNVDILQRASSYIANTLLTYANQAFEINHSGAPSAKFMSVGQYIVEGIGAGMTSNTDYIRKAALQVSEEILHVVQDYFKIESPSVVMKEEVGQYIVKGIADGITSDMSAEEAAVQKAENIKSAFQKVFEGFKMVGTTKELEFKLWQAVEGVTASDAESARRAEELLMVQLEQQGKTVNAARAQYQATLEALGEGASKTQDAYNTYLQEQINLAQLAQQLTETATNVSGAQEDMMVAYARLMGENKKTMYEQGFTPEEVEAWVSGQLGGYDPYNIEKTLSDSFDKTSIKSIMDHFTSDISVELDYTLTEAIKSGSAGASSAAYDAGSNLMEDINDGVKSFGEKVSDTVASVFGVDKNIFQGSVANAIEGLLDGLQVNGESALTKFKEFGTGILNSFNAALDIESPSKKFEDSGGYIVEGLVDGIDKNADKVQTSMDNLLNGILPNQETTVNVNTGVTNSSKNNAKNSLSSRANAAYNAGANLAKEYARGISEGDDEPKKAVQEIGRILSTELQTISTGMEAKGYNLTTNMLKGMQRGVEEGRSAAIQAIVNVAVDAYNKAKTTLAIHSPSKKFYELGKYVNLGFANGLREYSHYVSEASNESAQTAINTVSSAIMRANQLIAEDVKYEPIIRPVLDTQKIEEEWNSLSSDMSSMLAAEASTEIQVEKSRRTAKMPLHNPGTGLAQIRGNGMGSVSFVQNNYSPKSLSSATIYRQTKNQFSSFKKAVTKGT